jgi:hypothetical protein
MEEQQVIERVLIMRNNGQKTPPLATDLVVKIPKKRGRKPKPKVPKVITINQGPFTVSFN